MIQFPGMVDIGLAAMTRILARVTRGRTRAALP